MPDQYDDVEFRAPRFQSVEVIDPDHRHDEVKQLAERAQRAHERR